MNKELKEAFELNPTMKEAHTTPDGVIFPNKSAAVNHCVSNDLDFEKIEVTKRPGTEEEETEEEKAERLKKEEAEQTAKEEAEKLARQEEEKQIKELEKRIADGTATGEDKIAVQKHLEDKSISEEKQGFFKKFLSSKK